MGELDLPEWLRVEPMAPESKVQAVYDNYDHLAWHLFPRTDPLQSTDTVLILNPSATPPTQHIFTASIEDATFLERTFLQMRIEINKITPGDVGAELSQERCLTLDTQDAPAIPEAEKTGANMT